MSNTPTEIQKKNMDDWLARKHANQVNECIPQEESYFLPKPYGKAETRPAHSLKKSK